MRTRIQDQANNNFQILRELSMREKTQNITNNTGTRAHARVVKSKTNFERAIEKREEIMWCALFSFCRCCYCYKYCSVVARSNLNHLF